ncbi:MAG: metallophosphoesterase [Bacteroidales bacterium]|nr:metallophosphoesterase [Bacteroidales bacterium]
MQNTIRILMAIIIIVAIGINISCKKSDPVNPALPGENPFNNGSNERNMIVVLSDMHLGADINYAECNENRATLETLLYQIRGAATVKELVIAGDLIDEWFVPAEVDTYAGKGQSDFVQRVAATNKGVFDAFNAIIKDGKILVTYVPGNHDLAITAESVSLILPGINQARENQQGLGTYSPDGCPKLAIEHGHRYNFFCAPDPFSNKDIAPGSIMPPGYFFTRIATQHVIENCKTPGDEMPIVTPNTTGDASQYLVYVYWQVWQGLMSSLPVNEKFSDKMIVTNIDGYTQNYSINDLMPSQSITDGFIDMNLYKGIMENWDDRQNINNVPTYITLKDAISKSASNGATDSMALSQYFLNSDSDKRIVIFGHTHDPKIQEFKNLDLQKCIYANSGTWIDDNKTADTKMNFIVVTPQNNDASSQTYVKLYYCDDMGINEKSAESLRY